MALVKSGLKLGKKFEVSPRTPLQTEEEEDKMAPPTSLLHLRNTQYYEAQMMGLMQELKESYNDPGRKERVIGLMNAVAVKIEQQQNYNVDDKTIQDYVELFNTWLLGKSYLNDPKYGTFWGTRPLIGESIIAYLRQYVDVKMEYEKQLTKLKLNPPTDIKSAWLFFKYILTPERWATLDFHKDFNWWVVPGWSEGTVEGQGGKKPPHAKATRTDVLSMGDPGEELGSKTGSLFAASQPIPSSNKQEEKQISAISNQQKEENPEEDYESDEELEQDNAEELKRLKEANKEMQEKIQGLKGKNERLKALNKEKNNSYDQLQAESSKKDQLFQEKIKAKDMETDQMLTEATKEKVSISSKLDKAKNEIKEYQQKLDSVTAEKADLNAQLSTMQGNWHKSEKAKSTIENELEQVKKKNHEMITEGNDHANRMKILKNELESMNTLYASEKQSNEAWAAKTKAITDNNEIHMKEKTRAIENLEKDLTDLREKQKSIDAGGSFSEKDKQIKDLEESIGQMKKKYEAEMAELETENETISEKLNNATTRETAKNIQIDALKEKKKEMETQIKDKDILLKGLESQTAAQAKLLLEKKKKIGDLESQVSGLLTSETGNAVALSNLKKEYEVAKKEREAAIKESQALIQKVRDLNDERETLKSNLSVVTQSRDSLYQQTQDLTEGKLSQEKQLNDFRTVWGSLPDMKDYTTNSTEIRTQRDHAFQKWFSEQLDQPQGAQFIDNLLKDGNKATKTFVDTMMQNGHFNNFFSEVEKNYEFQNQYHRLAKKEEWKQIDKRLKDYEHTAKIGRLFSNADRQKVSELMDRYSNEGGVNPKVLGEASARMWLSLVKNEGDFIKKAREMGMGGVTLSKDIHPLELISKFFTEKGEARIDHYGDYEEGPSMKFSSTERKEIVLPKRKKETKPKSVSISSPVSGEPSPAESVPSSSRNVEILEDMNMDINDDGLAANLLKPAEHKGGKRISADTLLEHVKGRQAVLAEYHPLLDKKYNEVVASWMNNPKFNKEQMRSWATDLGNRVVGNYNNMDMMLGLEMNVLNTASGLFDDNLTMKDISEIVKKTGFTVQIDEHTGERQLVPPYHWRQMFAADSSAKMQQETDHFKNLIKSLDKLVDRPDLMHAVADQNIKGFKRTLSVLPEENTGSSEEPESKPKFSRAKTEILYPESEPEEEEEVQEKKLSKQSSTSSSGKKMSSEMKRAPTERLSAIDTSIKFLTKQVGSDPSVIKQIKKLKTERKVLQRQQTELI